MFVFSIYEVRFTIGKVRAASEAGESTPKTAPRRLRAGYIKIQKKRSVRDRTGRNVRIDVGQARSARIKPAVNGSRHRGKLPASWCWTGNSMRMVPIQKGAFGWIDRLREGRGGAIKLEADKHAIMPQPIRSSRNSSTLCVIMGGGQGTRLFPLTKDRAKPAVPLAGKYRLVDIPISNCINSGLRRIYVLTQFNSASLHRHISQSYKFDQFTGGFVEILAAQQTLADTSWYQGTADAVRKNLIHFLNHDFDYLLILSGDQLYRMDFRAGRRAARGDRRGHHHRHDSRCGRSEAPVAGHHADRRGAPDHALRGEAEGPGGAGFPAPARASGTPSWASQGGRELFLASMGIYVFNREVIRELLDNDAHRFRQAHHPAAPSRRTGSSPTSSRATGRTSEPSAPSSRPTSTSPPSCRGSISST